MFLLVMRSIYSHSNFYSVVLMRLSDPIPGLMHLENCGNAGNQICIFLEQTDHNESR